MEIKIIAPCGIDCFNCEMYEKNVLFKSKTLKCSISGSFVISE